MAKSNPFTIADLEAKGYTIDSTGAYAKNNVGKPYDVLISNSPRAYDTTKMGVIIKKTSRPKGKIKTPKPTITFPDKQPEYTMIVIPGLVAGLNGDKGMLRTHWAERKKIKELYQQIIKDHIREGKVKQHKSEVVVQYTGYKSSFMDWDNFCASFKQIGDALVAEGIIVDDSPKIIVKFIPEQVKSNRDGQHVLIIIKDNV